VYVSAARGGLPAPIVALADFTRSFALAGGQPTRLAFTLPPRAFAVFTDDGAAVVQAGDATVWAGAGAVRSVVSACFIISTGVLLM
jgi:hypothetical protein